MSGDGGVVGEEEGGEEVADSLNNTLFCFLLPFMCFLLTVSVSRIWQRVSGEVSLRWIMSFLCLSLGPTCQDYNVMSLKSSQYSRFHRESFIGNSIQKYSYRRGTFTCYSQPLRSSSNSDREPPSGTSNFSCPYYVLCISYKKIAPLISASYPWHYHSCPCQESFFFHHPCPLSSGLSCWQPV